MPIGTMLTMMTLAAWWRGRGAVRERVKVLDDGADRCFLCWQRISEGSPAEHEEKCHVLKVGYPSYLWSVAGIV